MAQKPTNHSDRRRCGLQRPHPIHSAVQPKKTDFPESGANPTWQRKQRKIGSKVEVYSSSAKTWYEGDITRIINDAEGEWVEVQYASRMMRLKQIFRDDITAIRPPSTKTMPISQQTTSSSSSSQSQPTHPQIHHELEQKTDSDDVVANLMGMGFGKEQCLLAVDYLQSLKVISVGIDRPIDTDLAVDYLLNGIPLHLRPKGRIIDDDSVSEESEPRRVCAPHAHLRHLASMAKYDEEVVGSPSLMTRQPDAIDTPAGPDDEMYIDDQEGMNVQEDTNGGDTYSEYEGDTCNVLFNVADED